MNKLQGQFAFAIFDSESETLHLYRDRLGILPLYYFVDSSKLIFASEIKALLPAIGTMPGIDKKSLSDYLTQRGVPAPNTLYDGIKKLEAGHHLSISKDGTIRDDIWYEIPKYDGSKENLDPVQAADQLESILYDAVGAALVADVPVGAYLSGGIDSSIICAMIAKHRGNQKGSLSTFSASFSDGSSLDETPFARTVSELLETDHH